MSRRICTCGPNGYCPPDCTEWVEVMPDVDRPRYENPHRADAPTQDPVVEAVRADLLARSAVGVRKYGCTLEGLMPREAMQHAYEEALDLANYLKRMMMTMDDAA